MGYGDNTGTLSSAGVSDAVWDELTAGHVGAGSFGKLVEDTLAAFSAVQPSGLFYGGTVDSINAGNKFTITALASKGAGKFQGATKPWQAYVWRDGGGASAAPQGEMQPITAYNNATGEFTTSAFTVAVAATDEIVILNPVLTEAWAIRAKTDLIVGTTLIAADVAVPTADVATNTSLRDVIGNKSDTIAGTSIVAIEKQIKAKTDNITGTTLIAADMAVPVADVATNTSLRDVIGNKSDTVAGTSVIALEKVIKAKTDNITGATLIASDIAVPTADVVTNTQIRDVVGNKADAAATTKAATKSLMAYVKGLLDELNETRAEIISVNQIFPANTSLNLVFTSGGAANTYGAWAEIADTGATALTTSFAASAGHVVDVHVEDNNGTVGTIYMYEISYGAGKTVVRRGRVISTGAGASKSQTQASYGIGGEIPLGETVYYRQKDSAGGKTMNLHLGFFTYS
jgi:hypothetical protein